MSIAIASIPSHTGLYKIVNVPVQNVRLRHIPFVNEMAQCMLTVIVPVHCIPHG